MSAWSNSAKAGLVTAMVAAILAAAVGTRMVTGSAFDALEADTVAGDASRVSSSIDYETRLLHGFGSTNSIWDSSYQDVATGDREGFLADFPPGDLVEMYTVDGAVGVGSTGDVVVGGLVGGDGFTSLPADLTPASLAAMVDFGGDAGAGRCGLVITSQSPFLWCGFPARISDGTGDPGFGLVFLRSLDDAALSSLGQSTGIELALGDPVPADATADLTLETAVGSMAVSTQVMGADSLQLTMTLPTLGDGQLVLSSTHARPIHATDGRTADATFAFLGAAVLVILGMIALLVRLSLRDQVAPLRSTTEQIIASGDRDVRLAEGRRGELTALSRTINVLLESIAGQNVELERGQQEREARLIESHQSKVRNDAQVRRRAQERVDATIATVIEELHSVLEHADRVQAAASGIAEGSSGSETITGEVLREAAAADQALGELDASLSEVNQIVSTIQTITEQTRMLALNATIEAARAGAAGAGFNVVAQEVRSLAAGTATSAAQIAETTGHVARTAARVASTLVVVTSRVAAVGAASDQVRLVADEQVVTVQALTDAVRDAVERVRAMSDLSESTERRQHERLPAFGTVLLRVDGTAHQVELRDISNGGVEVGLVDGARPAKGDRVHVTLPDDLGALEVEMRVAWADLDGKRPRAGLAVLTDSPGLGQAAATWKERIDL